MIGLLFVDPQSVHLQVLLNTGSTACCYRYHSYPITAITIRAIIQSMLSTRVTFNRIHWYRYFSILLELPYPITAITIRAITGMLSTRATYNRIHWYRYFSILLELPYPNASSSYFTFIYFSKTNTTDIQKYTTQICWHRHCTQSFKIIQNHSKFQYQSGALKKLIVTTVGRQKKTKNVSYYPKPLPRPLALSIYTSTQTNQTSITLLKSYFSRKHQTKQLHQNRDPKNFIAEKKIGNAFI